MMYDQSRHLDQQMSSGADDDAHDQPVDPHAVTGKGKRSEPVGLGRSKNHCSVDLPEIIEDRCQCGEQKMLICLQSAGEHSADGEDQHGDQIHAHQMDDGFLLFGGKTGCDPDLGNDQRTGKDCRQDGKQSRTQKCQIGDG